ncbi:CPBP family intramembrane metalloprotease [bacterium]|nr:CPBP family intramembrane metalloprotease [bacterium]
MKNKKEILTFLALLIVLTAACYVPIISAHSIKAGDGLYSTLLMWCPGTAAILTTLFFAEARKQFFKTLGLLPGKPIYWIIAYTLPLVYGLIAYSFIWTSGIGGFPNQKYLITGLRCFPQLSPDLAACALGASMLTIDFVINLHRGFGEELGWRGFLVPKLSESMSFAKTSTVIGCAWGLWHVPAIILTTDYNNGAPAWVGLSCFAVLVISISFILSWLRLKSNSVWPCAILHISHNVAIQGIFTPLTITRQYTAYFIDEFGIALAAVGALFAFIVWRKQRAKA